MAEPGRWRRPERTDAQESKQELVIVNAAYYGNVDGIRDAMMRGGDIEEVDPKEGWRPLHAAVMTEMEEAVDYLLKQKADISSPGPKGLTALHVACRDGSTEVLRVLLKHKADVQATDPQGHTALDLCRPGSRTGRIMEAFLAGAPLPTEDDLEDSQTHVPPLDPSPAPAPAPRLREGGTLCHPSWHREMRPIEFVDSEDEEAPEATEQVAPAIPAEPELTATPLSCAGQPLIGSGGTHTYGSAVDPDRDGEEERRHEIYAVWEQDGQLVQPVATG